MITSVHARSYPTGPAGPPHVRHTHFSRVRPVPTEDCPISLSLSLASLFPFHQPVTVDHRHPRDREGESTVDRVYVARGRAPPEAEGPAAAILTGPERAVAAGSAVKQHEGGKAKATHRHRPTTTARESPPTRGPAMCLPGSFRSRRHGAHEGRGALLRPRSARGRGGGTPSLVGVGLVSFACTTPPKRGTVRASPSSSAEEVCGFFFSPDVTN